MKEQLLSSLSKPKFMAMQFRSLGKWTSAIDKTYSLQISHPHNSDMPLQGFFLLKLTDYKKALIYKHAM